MRKKKQNIDYLEELEQQRKEKNSNTLIEPLEKKTEEPKVEENKPKEKKKRSKYPLYIGIILVATAVTLGLSLKDDFQGIINNFTTMNVPYFIYGALCFIGCFLINSLILFLFARRYKKKYYFHQAMANDCIGNFYNCITPSASGGQLMQAYTYKKQGVSLSNGTSCLVMNFIVYQGVMIVLATISVICKSGTLFVGDKYAITFAEGFSLPFWVVMILGYGLQFLVIGLILLMSSWRRFHNFILNRGINFFAKIKLVKNPDETRRSLAVSIDSFKVELKNLLVNPKFLILIVILHFACFACRYSIPYFINQAVLGDLTTSSLTYTYTWWDNFCYTSIHKMATELIPIPGAAGVSELFYVTVFEAAYSFKDPNIIMEAAEKKKLISSYIMASQILWRVVTFYVPLVISGFVTALYKGKPSKEEFNKASSGAQTYLTLTLDTFDERKKNYQTVYNTKQINKKDFDKWKKARKNGDEKK